MNNNENDEDTLKRVVTTLTDRFGRPPTEDEIYTFVFGTAEQKKLLWNLEKKEKTDGQDS